MAVATKTLTPTNQVVNLPDMTEKPNVSVLVEDIGKEADAINALSENLGHNNIFNGVITSISALFDAISTFTSEMSNEEVKTAGFTADSSADANIFYPNARYSGRIIKYGAGNWTGVFTSNTGEELVVGTYNGGSNKFYTSSRELNSSLTELEGRLDGHNAGSHNSIYRGKYLGSSVSSAQWAAIKNGTFDDLFVGDYWTINGVNWRIAGFNYWYNTGDTNCTKNHVVIVPDSNLVSCEMNSTNITTGAYGGSDFFTGNNSNTGKATAISAVNSAFGSGHILSHRELLATATRNGAPSGWTWCDSTVELMNEQMVYGSRVWGNQAGEGNGYDVGIDNAQLPLFQHDHSRICIRAIWWLRSVVSASNFAFVNYSGYASNLEASNSYGVRPVFGIFQS